MRADQPISIFMPSVHGGGAERAMLVFSGELVKRGLRVELVLANLEGALQDLIPKGVCVINLGSSRMLKAIAGLAAYFQSAHPLAIFSTITHANIAAIYAARYAHVEAPLVVRQSNAPISESKDSVGRFLTSRLIPLAYERASAVIAVSEGVRSELITLNRRLARKIQVLPTPVLTEQTKQQGEEPAPHRWFADRSVPVILSAGRLKVHKGMLELIRAFKRVRSRHAARLLIIGDGPERERLEAEVRRLGLQSDVELPGFFPNPFAFMRQASVFALASRYEGLPNVLIQAMSFGTPIVSTDCPSGPREILQDGTWGRLVTVGAEDELVTALEESLYLPKQWAAQENAWKRYGAAAAASEYLAVAGLIDSSDTSETAGSQAGLRRVAGQ